MTLDSDMSNTLRTDDRLLVDVKEAARLLSLSTAQVYELAASGRLPKAYVGKGTRNFRIPVDALRDYVSGLDTEPVPTQ